MVFLSSLTEFDRPSTRGWWLIHRCIFHALMSRRTAADVRSHRIDRTKPGTQPSNPPRSVVLCGAAGHPTGRGRETLRAGCSTSLASPGIPGIPAVRRSAEERGGAGVSERSMARHRRRVLQGCQRCPRRCRRCRRCRWRSRGGPRIKGNRWAQRATVSGLGHGM